MGNRKSQRLSDANTFSYDELNRLKQTNYFDGGVVNYAYTPTSQRQSVTDSRGTTSYSYDNRDRVTSILQAGTLLTVTYGYDANSNRTGLTTKAGATSYTYYDDNRLKTVVGPNDPVGTQSTFYYYPNGQRQQVSLANSVIVQYTYDPLNRLTNMQAGKNGLTLLSAYTYTLGLAGNRTGVVEAASGVVTSTKAWGYDDAYRLTSETITNTGFAAVTSNYSYDRTGNRLSMQTGGLVSNYAYNELDQLTSVISGSSTTVYSYKRGDLIQVKQGSTVLSSFGWDAADRLVAATVYTSSSTTASYGYDADGRRVKQTITPSGGSATVKNFLWDELSTYGDVVLEADTSNAVQTSYVLVNCGCGIGSELISQYKVSGGLTYLLKDGQGSIRALTDSNGNLVSGENYSYDAFGNLKSSSTNPATNYLYTGQQYDSLTQVYDLRARYYAPSIARYWSQDYAPYLLDDPIEINRYSYVANNPINYYDPSGLFFAELNNLWNSLSPAQKILIVVGGATVIALSYLLRAPRVSWSSPWSDSINFRKPTAPPYDNPGKLRRVKSGEKGADGREGPTYAEKGGELGENDDDWRGQDKTLDEALHRAGERTGVPFPSDEWTPTQYAPDEYGKEHPVEWRGPNGEVINIDRYYPGTEGPKVPHVGWDTGTVPGAKRSRNQGARGHVLLDSVPRARPPIGQER